MGFGAARREQCQICGHSLRLVKLVDPSSNGLRKKNCGTRETIFRESEDFLYAGGNGTDASHMAELNRLFRRTNVFAKSPLPTLERIVSAGDGCRGKRRPSHSWTILNR
jgi:hypothetical protein